MKNDVMQKVNKEYIKSKEAKKTNYKNFKCIASGIDSTDGIKSVIKGVGVRYFDKKIYNSILENGYNNKKKFNDNISIIATMNNKTKNLKNVLGYSIIKYNSVITTKENKININFNVKNAAVRLVIKTLFNFYKVTDIKILNNSTGKAFNGKIENGYHIEEIIDNILKVDKIQK